jgi:hypothetical protein
MYIDISGICSSSSSAKIGIPCFAIIVPWLGEPNI